jgi:hypothetical protein
MSEEGARVRAAILARMEGRKRLLREMSPRGAFVLPSAEAHVAWGGKDHRAFSSNPEGGEDG